MDFALLLNDGKQVSWDMKLDVDKDGVTEWMEVVQEAKALGFEWGGDWTTFKDYPHLQMVFGLKISDLRAPSCASTTCSSSAILLMSSCTSPCNLPILTNAESICTPVGFLPM